MSGTGGRASCFAPAVDETHAPVLIHRGVYYFWIFFDFL